MSIIGTARELFEASSSARVDVGSDGAYWCHDCDERLRDVDVESREPPACPSCGDKMEFERSVESTGCAC